MSQKFELGQELCCKVTGFQGVATSYLKFINGCVQYCLKPKVRDDGKYPDGTYIDVENLEYAGPGVYKKIEARPGGGESMSESKLHG